VSGFLALMGLIVLVVVLLGLVLVLRGPGDAERLMAAQLLGTGGVAALLLLGSAVDLDGTTDLAIVLAVLSAFAAIAFVIGLGAQSASRPTAPSTEGTPFDASAEARRVDSNG
jgi:multicomponent Na+:H+ antiporter subunit F